MKISKTRLIWLLWSFGVLWEYADALHCFSHDHCGNHAVCINPGIGQTPKCMCLVGFAGNGARCDRLNASSTDKIDQIILQKSGCASGKQKTLNENDAPPGIRPDDENGNSAETKSSIAQKRTLSPNQNQLSLNTLIGKNRILDLDQAVNQAVQKFNFTSPTGKDNLITSPPIKINNGKECEKVNCDFDHGACRYRSLGEVSWIRKPKKSFNDPTALNTDFVASIQPNEASEQYLASENFVLLEDTTLRFKYFENDRSPHIQLCDNDLSHCFWQSDGVNGKWTEASVILPSGTHRLIIAVNDIGPRRSIAIDDIRLESNDGEPASCV